MGTMIDQHQWKLNLRSWKQKIPIISKHWKAERHIHIRQSLCTDHIQTSHFWMLSNKNWSIYCSTEHIWVGNPASEASALCRVVTGTWSFCSCLSQLLHRLYSIYLVHILTVGWTFSPGPKKQWEKGKKWEISKKKVLGVWSCGEIRPIAACGSESSSHASACAHSGGGSWQLGGGERKKWFLDIFIKSLLRTEGERRAWESAAEAQLVRRQRGTVSAMQETHFVKGKERNPSPDFHTPQETTFALKKCCRNQCSAQFNVRILSCKYFAQSQQLGYPHQF